MTGFEILQEVEERVILVGVSTGEGDDTEQSLDELEELAKTAGAVTVGRVIQNREQIHPGTYIGTGKIADDKLAQLVRECFDLRPAAIIKTLDLRRPIYRQTAGYGHFGRAELDLPWEKTDMVQTLLAKA